MRCTACRRRCWPARVFTWRGPAPARQRPDGGRLHGGVVSAAGHCSRRRSPGLHRRRGRHPARPARQHPAPSADPRREQQAEPEHDAAADGQPVARGPCQHEHLAALPGLADRLRQPDGGRGVDPTAVDALADYWDGSTKSARAGAVGTPQPGGAAGEPRRRRRPVRPWRPGLPSLDDASVVPGLGGTRSARSARS